MGGCGKGRMSPWGALVSMLDMGTQGAHATAWGPDWRGALVQEGPTIHSVGVREAGMRVQGGPRGQCNKAQNVRTGFSVGQQPKCAGAKCH